MAKLSDKAFYNKGKKATRTASVPKKLLTAEDLYDTIVRSAQSQLPSQLQEGEHLVVQAGGINHLFHVANGTLWCQSSPEDPSSMNPDDSEPIDPEQADALYVAMKGQNNMPQTSQMQPQAPQPDMNVNQVPVQDKVQQFKEMGLNDQQVEQVMKVAADENEESSESTEKESAPGDENDPEKKDKTPPVPGEPSEVKLPDEEPRLSPETDEDKRPYQKPESLPDLNQQRPVEDLMSPEHSMEQRQGVILSFLGYVAMLQAKATRIRNQIRPPPEWRPNSEGVGVRVPGVRAPGGAELKALEREDAKIERQIERAGSMYKKLIRLIQPKAPTKKQLAKDPNAKPTPGMPQTEALQWLEQEMAKRHRRPPALERPMQPKGPAITQDQADQFPERMVHDDEGSTPKKSDAGNDPAGTAAHPMDGQRDTLSKEEIPGTGKLAQAAPPGAPGQSPGGPPTPSAPPAPGMDQGMGMDPGLVEEKVEDPRSLAEVLEDLELDVESLVEKISKGDAMLHGEEVEPVETDSGAMPAPAPMVADKQAVDQEAKDYYKDYFGDYGMALTKDRVAELVDLIDEAAADYGIMMTAAQISKLADLLAIDTYDTNNPDFVRICDKINAGVAIKSGMYLTEYRPWGVLKAALDLVAYNTMTPTLKAKHDEFIRLADSKIKKPKVKGQPDDAVKVDKLKDRADTEDSPLSRPPHLHLELDKHSLDGAYLKMTIKWDADAEAANRSDDGLKQMVLSFVKGLESQKEFIDLGYLGQITIEEFDAEAGMAEVSVRTRKPGDAPLKVDTAK